MAKRQEASGVKKNPRNKAQNSPNKEKRKPRGKPFALGNPWRFQKGQSGNPGGRPKLLSEAYREWLKAEDDNGVTNAARVALTTGYRAAVGDIQAAKEIRAATEGEKLTLSTWQSEIVEALKAGKLTAQDVVNELGLEDARAILIAAGQAIPTSAPESADADGTTAA